MLKRAFSGRLDVSDYDLVVAAFRVGRDPSSGYDFDAVFKFELESAVNIFDEAYEKLE